MTKIISGKGIEITQHELQQILLRGKGDGSFAETVNKEISLLPPSDNLRMINNEKYLFAKQSFDQWSLLCLETQSEEEILKLVSAMNTNEEILLIEDVITSGQSILETIQIIEENNLKIGKILTIIDREAGGVKMLREKDYNVECIFTKSELI